MRRTRLLFLQPQHGAQHGHDRVPMAVVLRNLVRLHVVIHEVLIDFLRCRDETLRLAFLVAEAPQVLR
jgi:hypothetical protein